MTEYDSRPDTWEHIHLVQKYMQLAISELMERALVHDQSKLTSPEKEVFDEFTPKLKGSTYGSLEYKEFLEKMQVGLQHHYGANTHHPEHWPDGIRDMDLFDILEMLCDWRAATERHANGSITESIKINKERFGYSDELEQILWNTVYRMRWYFYPDGRANGMPWQKAEESER